MQLESELLRSFLAVCDAGSLSGAARGLNLTQSALSVQMRRLEDVVGKRLFTRGPRGVELTQIGSDLLPNARRIVVLLDETTAAVRGDGVHGPVRIGIPEEYAHDILARALRVFAERHAKVDLSIRHGRSSENVARIRSDELDVAVTFDWRGDTQAEVLMRDPTVWVTSDRHMTQERVPIPIAICENFDWSREYALKSMERSRLAYRVAVTSDDNGGLRLAASSGLAIAPMSRSSIPMGCRELTREDGFDAIDDSRLVLHINPRSSGDALRALAAAVRRAFSDDVRSRIPGMAVRSVRRAIQNPNETNADALRRPA